MSSAFQQVRLELGAGLGGLVASTHRPYWTADYFADERFRHTSAIDSAVGDEGIVAHLRHPAARQGRVRRGALRRQPLAAHLHPRRGRPARLPGGARRGVAGAGGRRSTRCAATPRALERAAAAHDRFAGIVLRGGGVGEITEALHSLLGVWVVLVDDEGVERSAAGPVPDVPDEAAAVGSPATARRHPYAVDAPLDTAGRLIRTGDRWVVPVSAVDLPLGQLVVGGPADLDDADRRTVERAAVVTALVLLGERQRADAQLQVRTDLVADLLSGRADLRAVVGAARTLGVDLRSPCCVLVATAPDAATSRRSLVMSVTAALGGAALVAEHRGEVVAIVQRDDPSAAAVELAQRISAVEPAHRRRLRAGRRATGAAGRLPRGAAHGIRAGGAGAHRVRRQRRPTSASPGSSSGSDPEVRDYVRSVLGPLLDYDGQRGADLVRTTEAYFQAGSSPRHAATDAARARQHGGPAAAPHRRAARHRLAGPEPGPADPARAAPAPPHRLSTASCTRRSSSSDRPAPARLGARLLEGEGVAQGLARAVG